MNTDLSYNQMQIKLQKNMQTESNNKCTLNINAYEKTNIISRLLGNIPGK